MGRKFSIKECATLDLLLKGLTYSEVAEQLDIPVSTVKTRLWWMRARSHMLTTVQMAGEYVRNGL